MRLTVLDTDIKDVKIILSPTIFEDHRGTYREIWNILAFDPGAGVSELRGIGPQIWVSDDISTSHQNVLRGIHGDYKTWKLVSCLYGRLYLVVVDNRPDSPTYREYISLTLSDRNYLSVLIPPGCGNGHLVLSPVAVFHYKQSEWYDPAGQFTIPWDDRDLDIFWPLTTLPITSRRDESVSGRLMQKAMSENKIGRDDCMFGIPVIDKDNGKDNDNREGTRE